MAQKMSVASALKIAKDLKLKQEAEQQQHSKQNPGHESKEVKILHQVNNNTNNSNN